MLVAGCAKEPVVETIPEETQSHLTFDITVNRENPATRAVQTGWENGDKIYLFFFDKYTDDSCINHLTMTYDGSGWSYEFSNANMESDLLSTTEGSIFAIYLPSVTPSFSSATPIGLGRSVKIQYADGSRAISYTSASAEYTITGSKMSATLNMSLDPDFVQFFIPGISEGSMDNYTFRCNHLKSKTPTYITIGDKQLSPTVGNNNEILYGFPYKGGLIFCGVLDDCYGQSADYVFTVTDDKGNLTSSDDVVYTKTFKGKTLDQKDAVALPALSSWIETRPDGKTYINGHEGVDMGNGLYWATENITTNEGNICYFAWGEIYTKTDYNWESYFDGTLYYVETEYGTTAWRKDFTHYSFAINKTRIEPQDDVATQRWGGTWRIPTEAEWQWLLDNCNCVTGKNITGPGMDNEPGAIFVSKINVDKQILLRAWGRKLGKSPSGDGSDIILNIGEEGYYWSSDLDSYYSGGTHPSTWAHNLHFYVSDNSFLVTSSMRDTGYCIRPVAD